MIRPEAIQGYFWFVAVVHLVAIATRFDELAARIPASAATAILIAQFPLLVLSAFVEGQLDHGNDIDGNPSTAIRSRPVKTAFTFAFIYLCLVVLQTLGVSLGPINPTPPAGWPTAQRALWFAGFSLGMSFVFYLAAARVLIPVLRVVTYPLHRLGPIAGSVVALVLGAALGIAMFAVVSRAALGAFVGSIKASLYANPALYIGVTLGCILVPLMLSALLARRRR